jgi:CheY-like chemotaxis protein
LTREEIMTVAVVDDYEDLAVMITRSLELEGFDVRRLPIDIGLFAAETWEDVDAVIVDLSMPISGLAVLGHLRSNYPRIRRVICSAMDSLIEEASREDPDAVVVRKPMRTAELIRALQERRTLGPA